ncbi:uncharacterized protein LOC119670507 [Teleopsis dalmanni]|uniref:uncharacterized protein LOC119670491 n=1 Tax=Teleopsis dalmanni TaxID=139649 RepID=UPI000D32A8B1|nr:uncharacterized protein LOC119670491 [Teleopsis dalmanni]XP_037936708.1 uncharacterized protein LOC119670507 [Teleopsis dalmanni]
MENDKKASEQQKLVLLEFIESNKQFSKDSSHVKKKVWKILAERLNGLGGANKSGKKWRKFWLDLKNHIKDKAAVTPIKSTDVNCMSKPKVHSDVKKRMIPIMAPPVVDEKSSVEEMCDFSNKHASENMTEKLYAKCLDEEELMQPQAAQSKCSAHETIKQRKKKSRHNSKSVKEEMLALEKIKFQFEKDKFAAKQEYRREIIEMKKMKIELLKEGYKRKKKNLPKGD